MAKRLPIPLIPPSLLSSRGLLPQSCVPISKNVIPPNHKERKPRIHRKSQGNLIWNFICSQIKLQIQGNPSRPQWIPDSKKLLNPQWTSTAPPITSTRRIREHQQHCYRRYYTRGACRRSNIVVESIPCLQCEGAPK
jgi:hypothetical protein